MAQQSTLDLKWMEVTLQASKLTTIVILDMLDMESPRLYVKFLESGLLKKASPQDAKQVMITIYHSNLWFTKDKTFSS